MTDVENTQRKFIYMDEKRYEVIYDIDKNLDYLVPAPLAYPEEASAEVREIFDNAPENNDPTVWIQWKGTDVCFDLHCACGAHGHYDGYGAYTVICPKCEQEWVLPMTLALWKPTKDDYPRLHPPVADVGFDDEQERMDHYKQRAVEVDPETFKKVYHNVMKNGSSYMYWSSGTPFSDKSEYGYNQ